MNRIALAFLLLPSMALAQDGPIPKHLELARELVASVKPENNQYVLRGPEGVRFKGDFLTTENTVHTHCTGLVGAVLERAHSPTVQAVQANTRWRKYLRVNNYDEAINNGYGFTKISRLPDARAGDIFLFRCNDGCANSQSSDIQGHITILDAAARPKQPTPPLIEGTLQWVVTIIDSADAPHSKDDTRVVAPGMPKVTGVGRGSYRIYTDLDGVPVGYTNGPNGPKFHSSAQRPINLGRPSPY